MGRDFSFRQHTQTGSGAHPATHAVQAGSSLPEKKRENREADHSPPPSPEVMNVWSYTSIQTYLFVICCWGHVSINCLRIWFLSFIFSSQT